MKNVLFLDDGTIDLAAELVADVFGPGISIAVVEEGGRVEIGVAIKLVDQLRGSGWFRTSG